MVVSFILEQAPLEMAIIVFLRQCQIRDKGSQFDCKGRLTSVNAKMKAAVNYLACLGHDVGCIMIIDEGEPSLAGSFLSLQHCRMPP